MQALRRRHMGYYVAERRKLLFVIIELRLHQELGIAIFKYQLLPGLCRLYIDPFSIPIGGATAAIYSCHSRAASFGKGDLCYQQAGARCIVNVNMNMRCAAAVPAAENGSK